MGAGLALGAWYETMPLKQGIKYDLRFYDQNNAIPLYKKATRCRQK